MNLHIVPDNVFINKFYANLQELQLDARNRIVVRSNSTKLKYIKHNLPFAKPYTDAFDNLVGQTNAYSKVFIHQFTPLLYRWVAQHDFRELNWMVWGADLYNLPSFESSLYEPLTRAKYINRRFSLNALLYRAKVALLHAPFRDQAYGKVNHVLTWMKSEYTFAREHLSRLNAAHQFFFYENDMPYQALDQVMNETPAPSGNDRPVYILGNSATPELNHLDAVAWMNSEGIAADLVVPISYGVPGYGSFLKKELRFYKGGKLSFIEKYMDFQHYLRLLNSSDGLIMNNIRPQGYGNIFMMMYLGKKVFLNQQNLSITDLDKAGLAWQPLTEMGRSKPVSLSKNRLALMDLLSHDVLLKTYRALFS